MSASPLRFFLSQAHVGGTGFAHESTGGSSALLFWAEFDTTDRADFSSGTLISTTAAAAAVTAVVTAPFLTGRCGILKGEPLPDTLHVKNKVGAEISSVKNTQELTDNWGAVSVHECSMGVYFLKTVKKNQRHDGEENLAGEIILQQLAFVQRLILKQGDLDLF